MVTVDFFGINIDELEIQKHTQETAFTGLFNNEQVSLSDEELLAICSEPHPALNHDGKIYLESLLQFLN